MLTLASTSPRRRDLLHNAGIEFIVRSPDVPEVQKAGECPTDFATRLAYEKAHAIWQQSRNGFVIGADTLVLVDSEVLGKPRDADDAARMLRLLSGRSHQVATAVCLMKPDGTNDARREVTRVHMSELSEKDIAEYVSHGEPMDKAGAYAIQGIASRWIYRIEGDYFNVVGLPVALVYRLLREHGAIPEW
jgi:septum formation protein